MKDEFTKAWITENALSIISRYQKGILTLRGLHYQLVAIGMTNSMNHYKRVVKAMIDARWDGLVDFDTFSDLDRSMEGFTDYEETNLDDKVEQGKEQIQAWMRAYRKNRWENQEYYPEVLIEKKALQGVFDQVTWRKNVGLGACKGYPSLTFLYELSLRMARAESEGKIPVIIYFGDYDPSGEDIPRAIQENLSRMGVDVQIDRIALLEDQVIEWNLPPAPAKLTDTRTANWDGLGQVELDAVPPEKLQELCSDAIDRYFDEDKYEELKEQETEEREKYQAELKDFVQTL